MEEDARRKTTHRPRGVQQVFNRVVIIPGTLTYLNAVWRGVQTFARPGGFLKLYLLLAGIGL